jgi:hypothetical protein
MPHRSPWNVDTVVAALRAFVLDHHRAPTAKECDTHVEGLPSSGTISHTCKHWRELLAKENIVVPRVTYKPQGDINALFPRKR